MCVTDFNQAEGLQVLNNTKPGALMYKTPRLKKGK